MSQVKAMRRAVAKIQLEEAADSIPHVGHKLLYHFWPLLSPCFRDVLVAPHYLIDEEVVTWTWREAENAPPPSAVELGELRRRLEGAMERFSQDVAAGRVGRGSGSSAPGVAGNAEQLEAVMLALVKELVGRPEADLKRFVCRTEHGLRVHSWGAGTPARPAYPETRGLEIAGRVLVAGQPARHDVVLESSDGETIAEVPSDEAGEFSFSKLSPGEYRLRARSVRGTFPPHGLPVDLHQRSVKGLVLANARADTVSPLVSARRAAGRRSRRTLPLVVLVVLALAGGAWGWRTWQAPSQPEPVSTAARATAGSGADATLPHGQAAVARTDAPNGPSLALSTGATTGGAHLSAASLPATRAMELREVVADGREPAPAVILPTSTSGNAGGAGAPPPNGAAGGGPAVAARIVSTENVRAAAPAGSPPVIESDGGAPAAAPEVTAAAHAARSASPAAPPAAAAPAPGSGSASTAGSASAAAASPVVVTARADVAAEVDPRPPAPAPVGPEVAPPSTTLAAAAETDVATPRAENTRETTEAAAPVASATVARREDALVPPTPSPAATVELTATPVPAIAPASAPVGLRTGPERTAPMPLTRTVRVRVSPWRARLLADTILPTEPILRAKPEPVALLRARLLAEKEARLPQAMREPRGRWGVALDLGNLGADETLTWLDAEGGRPEGANVTGERAEILWAPVVDDSDRQFRLSRRDGSFVAEVRVGANGRDFTVRTTEETRARLVLAVRVDASSHPVLDSGGEAKPFSWRSGSANALPSGWRERVGVGAAGETIAEAPLGSLPGAAALQTGVLFDPETGWAIVSDIRQAADRPLGN